MTLSRAILISFLALASTSAFAAEPKLDAASANSSFPAANPQLRSNLEVPRLVPWFTGVKPTPAAEALDWSISPLGKASLLLPGTMGEKTCYKLRAYKVKRQERFKEGESASLGYSTCQWASKYQVHSAVQTVEEPPR